jgi:hypothetical protein
MLSPHQYLDSDDSEIPQCVSTSVGAERLQQITKWARRRAAEARGIYDRW